MSSMDAAPPSENPANTDASTEPQPPQKSSDKPRDSKGWDGKLRVEKKVLVDGKDQDATDVQTDAEESEDEGPPPESLAADEDLLDDTPADEEDIDLVHFRISSIPALRLERFKQLKVRCAHMEQR